LEEVYSTLSKSTSTVIYGIIALFSSTYIIIGCSDTAQAVEKNRIGHLAQVWASIQKKANYLLTYTGAAEIGYKSQLSKFTIDTEDSTTGELLKTKIEELKQLNDSITRIHREFNVLYNEIITENQDFNRLVSQVQTGNIRKTEVESKLFKFERNTEKIQVKIRYLLESLDRNAKKMDILSMELGEMTNANDYFQLKMLPLHSD
jgi:chromosome segregation ATPase